MLLIVKSLYFLCLMSFNSLTDIYSIKWLNADLNSRVVVFHGWSEDEGDAYERL
jgi:hypothetical protein